MLKLQIKGKELLELSGATNAHRLALRAQVSYPTIDRIVNRSGSVQVMDLSVLAHLLTLGLGLPEDEVMSMPLSSFFDLVDTDQ